MSGILKVLNAHQGAIMGSREISRQLKHHGIELTERTVRYHMKIMDERGYTEVFGKEGRKITESGLKELASSGVLERIGFINSKIEALSFQTSFDIDTARGDIILNVSFFPEGSLDKAVKAMKPVFKSPYVMSDRVIIARGGESIGDTIVPKGHIGLGTVCSVTINGVFLHAGIPVASRFGGVLEVDNGNLSRFTALISYEGSSLDPLLIFIKGGMTAVNEAVRKKPGGKILASFREIPVVSIEKAEELTQKLGDIGIGGILSIGNPNQPLLEMPVGMDKAGMILVGGLNPAAALAESGIESESKAMAILYPYTELVAFSEAIKKI